MTRRADEPVPDRRIPAPRPLIAGPLAVVALAFFLLPLVGLIARAPWRTLFDELGSSELRTALRLSIQCSLLATVLSVALGVPLAWVFARTNFRGRTLARALVTLPMVVPPVVGGIALLLAFGRRGVAGGPLYDATGVAFPFTTAGVVIAEAFVAMPFLIVTAEAGFRSIDRRFEDASLSLGASRWTTMRRVTIPLAWPSLVAGAALAWARALGEFGATIAFAGNRPGVTQTLPLAAYLRLEGGDPEAAIVISLILLAVSLVVLIGLRGRWLGPG